MKKNTMIDSLESLYLFRQKQASHTTLDYFIIWFRILNNNENKQGYHEFSDKLKENIDKKLLANDKSDLFYYYLLLFLCYKELLMWEPAIKNLNQSTKYMAYNIEESYIYYCYGRLFYDIDEFMEDFNSLRALYRLREVKCLSELKDSLYKVIKKNRIINLKDLSVENNFEERINCNPWNVSLFFFEKALKNSKEQQKEHYCYWYALANFKKAKYELVHGEKVEFVRKNLQENEQNFRNAEFWSRGKIKNINFDWGINDFYIAMCIRDDKSISFLRKAKEKFHIAKNVINASTVKNEYTFRRESLDFEYFYLLTLIELYKIDKEHYIYDLSTSLDEFCHQLRNNGGERVEYYISIAQAYDEIGEFEKAEEYWENAKELDLRKFTSFPYKIGMAFHNTTYRNIWDSVLDSIKRDKINKSVHEVIIQKEEDFLLEVSVDEKIKEHYKDKK